MSVVSLRDVARCIKLFQWFLDTLAKIRQVEAKSADPKNAASPPPPPEPPPSDKPMSAMEKMRAKKAAAEFKEQSVYSKEPSGAKTKAECALEALSFAAAHCYYFRWAAGAPQARGRGFLTPLEASPDSLGEALYNLCAGN